MAALSLAALSLAALSLAALSLAAGAAHGQGARSDYERASRLASLTRDKVFKTKVDAHWFAGNTRFWYRNDLPKGARRFVLVDAVKGVRSAAFDHAKLAESLSKTAGKEVHADRLPIDRIETDESAETVYFRAMGKAWKCDLKTYATSESEPPKKDAKNDRKPDKKPDRKGGPKRKVRLGNRTTKSPDGKWETFVKDHDLYLRKKEGGKEFALTDDGKPDDAYESGVFWLPDSTRFIALRRSKEGDRKIYLVESSPEDQLQPKLHSFHYLKPGDPVAATKPHLFDVAARKRVDLSDELFSNPYQTRDFRWYPDRGCLTFLYNQRGHTAMRIVEIDARSGKARPIVDEQCKTFFDYAHKYFCRYLEGSREIIWMSERDGWNHLYLYDSVTGKVKNQITRGEWVVRGVDRVDEDRRRIWFRAGGIYPEQDPYYIHFCRINFDGSGLVVLTEGDGTHAIEYSPDKRFFIDTYSRVDMPPVSELRRTEDGKLVCELERGDMTALLATGWQAPLRFVAKGRDGKTDIFGVIWRPTTFDPKKKYPVIEKIYAGPQGSSVPKRFAAFNKAQSMAEIGFIVVEIDGMGTSHRSKAFHDVCWKNIGDFGLADRILWIKAAAKKYPYMDLTRVGIYGGSAGGQASARAILEHPDFYKVCVSASGCHDNRMDKIWWNELWMSWPVGPQYVESSNVTHAHKLQGKLLLIVCELDRNVDPASTMQLVNALIKADKDFEMLYIPGAGHGDGGPYGERRRRDFFVRHLLGVEPRSKP